MKLYELAIQKPKMTSDYGYRIHPIYKTRRFHNGVDLISQVGNKNLFAVGTGYVQKVVNNQSNSKSGFGNYIWIRYPEYNLSLIYAHCSKILKKKGDNVKKGDIVAVEGKTGAATGVHLHLGMTKIGSNTWLNPNNYNVKVVSSKYNLTRNLKKGCKGEDVKKLQKALGGLTVDGVFGNKTVSKVKTYQKKKKLTADGVVGKNTAHVLGWTFKGK